MILVVSACLLSIAPWASARAQVPPSDPAPEAPDDGEGAEEAGGTEEAPGDGETQNEGQTADDDVDGEAAAGDDATPPEGASADADEEDYSAYDDDDEDYSAYDDDDEVAADAGAVDGTEPPPVDGSRVPAGAIVFGAGVGIALIGALTGAYVLNAESRLESECPGDVCHHELESTRDAAQTLAIVTDVLLITGGVVAAAGIALWAIFGGADAEPAEDSPANFSAACSPSGCAATVSGRF